MLSIDGCCHTVNTSPHSSSLLESHSPEVCRSDFGDFNENFSRFCTNPVLILQSLQRLLSQRGDTMAFFQAVTKHLDMKTLTGFSRNLGFSEVPGSNAGPLSFIPRRWATKKAGGSTQNGRDSKPKFLGVKKFGGEKVIPGNIIVRQRGTRFHPGSYVGMGKDHTLYALKQGHVKFERSKMTGRKWVHVVPLEGHVLHPVYQQS